MFRLISLTFVLAGSALLFRRRKHMTGGDRDTARACCYLLASGVVLLLLADVFEFSWRYQLPAVITLPPAGALGITVIIGYLRINLQRLFASGSQAADCVNDVGPLHRHGIGCQGR